MSDKMNGRDFVIGALVGGVIGAVTALLFAPKSGRELRSDLADQAQQLGDKTKQIANNVSSQTSEWIGKAKDVAGTVVEEVKAWKDAGKEVAVATLEEAKSAAVEQQQELESETKDTEK
ncbi:YtxH domain-containing protein [Paenibacillus sp. J2TS4]|uniref:YtxH domain-containing protein n=1 Tax=Paenibacillus sp. J2TS4 TaxID=2807194 RepID=UPI001B02F5F8|nr:YtxH domain-containing protein [Paenibacillus sp. J2TS4]GIP33790.1 hypothetical protein J2TS4_30000 [Paenibacillus sp. J2TS4]